MFNYKQSITISKSFIMSIINIIRLIPGAKAKKVVNTVVANLAKTSGETMSYLIEITIPDYSAFLSLTPMVYEIMGVLNRNRGVIASTVEEFTKGIKATEIISGTEHNCMSVRENNVTTIKYADGREVVTKHEFHI